MILILKNDWDPLLHARDSTIPTATDSDDNQDNLECLKRVRSLYQPLSVILPLAAVSDNDDDSVDNLETVRAIMKRFSTYGEGMFELLYALNFEFLFRILVIVF